MTRINIMSEGNLQRCSHNHSKEVVQLLDPRQLLTPAFLVARGIKPFEEFLKRILVNLWTLRNNISKHPEIRKGKKLSNLMFMSGTRFARTPEKIKYISELTNCLHKLCYQIWLL